MSFDKWAVIKTEKKETELNVSFYDIKNNSEMIKWALGKDYIDTAEKDLENIIWKEKKEVKEKAQKEIRELSDEVLQTISNKEFLKLSPEKRLIHITKNWVSANEVSSETVKELDFTFTYEWKFNKELYLRTTAGQVLPKEVRSVVKGWLKYSRTWLKWEFFTEGNKRLIIKEDTNIKDIEVWDIREIEAKNTGLVADYIRNNPEAKEFSDIIWEAYARDIDPKFAILAFSEKVKDKSAISVDRRIEIEEVFTEFDRLRSGISMWGWKKLDGDKKYPDEFTIRIFKEFAGDKWKDKAKDYWVKETEIKRLENLNTAKYLTLSTRQDIISKAPDKLKELILRYFPKNEYENALLVCHWESGFNFDAKNDKNRNWSVDRGVFQINSIHADKYAWQKIFVPEVNVKIASQIFREAWNSWRPWYAARKIGLA